MVAEDPFFPVISNWKREDLFEFSFHGPQRDIRNGWSPVGVRINDFHQDLSPAFSAKYFFKNDRKNLANLGKIVN
jgi:hypothetical protein